MESILLGSVLVPDLANPRAQDVDVSFMRYRLATIVRFSGHPAALSLAEHHDLCGAIAEEIGCSQEAIEWSKLHDAHEYATGDIVAPLQRVARFDGMKQVQLAWDKAICAALGVQEPSEEVRRDVKNVDLIAMAMEWRHCLGRPIDELAIGKIDLVRRISDRRFIFGRVLSPSRLEEIQYGRSLFAAA